MSELAQATINGADLIAWGDAAIEPGAAIAFDLRAPEGPTPIVEQINRLVDLGMAVGMADAGRYSSSYSSHVDRSSETTINGGVHVHTQATDARGIAADIEPHLHRGQAAGRADYGLA